VWNFDIFELVEEFTTIEYNYEQVQTEEDESSCPKNEENKFN